MAPKTNNDFLGQPYITGDLVIYPQAYGSHMVQLVLGRVLEIKEDSVVVEPIKGSRRGPTYGRFKWIDKRTGETINPDKHIKKAGHYKERDTGKELSIDEYRRQIAYPYSDRESWRYVPTECQDYVAGVTVPTRRVIIKLTENIIRVGGEDD